MAWCFEDEASPETDQVLEQVAQDGALVPAIWALEVVNVLVTAERRRRLTAAQSNRFLELLRNLPISTDEHPLNERAEAVLAVAREHGLSAYDGCYLELAARSGLPLATRDQRVRAAAKSLGVEVLARPPD